MDDFEDDELYDDYEYDNDGQEYESESLKDKYDKAKEYKEKFDEYKQKYNNYKNKSANKPANEIGKNAANNAGKNAAKEGGKELAKESGKKAGEEIVKQAGKKATTEAGKQVAKEGAKIAAKESAKVAVEGAAASTGVGVVVAAAIEVADRLNKIKKKIDKKTDSAIEEATGIKNFSKKKKLIPILLIIAIIMLIFIVPAMAMYSVSETATSELTTLVRAREENNGGKKLILFTKSELNELLKKDKNVSEDIAKKLADEGYTLERNDDGTYKSVSYKNILKNYGSDLTSVFMPFDLTGATDGMEELLEDGETYDSLKQKDKDVAVSLNNVKKYLMAEIDNFNEGVKWQTSNLSVNYINEKAKEKYTTYSDYKNSTVKVKADGQGELINEEITKKNYTVKDKNEKDTMLKMPKLSEYGVDVSVGENKVALTYVEMLEPHMQKWVIPYSIYIDTQDDDFVNSVMKNMYHPAEISLFQLKRMKKTTEFEYYMKCYKYILTVTTTCEGAKCTTTQSKGNYEYNLTTQDYKPGRTLIEHSSTDFSATGVYEVVELYKPYEIATDSSGNPLVKKISIKRSWENAPTQPELTYAASFYQIIDREYKINPVDENNQCDISEESDLKVDDSGIGKQTLNEYWDERVSVVSSEVDEYGVSYYTEEQMETLGRKISRIEWYQDALGVSGSVSSGAAGSVSLGFGSNVFEKAYNGGAKETIERLWDGIISWGYTEVQAAAILGNIAQESGYNVTAVNSQSGALGVCQWLDRRPSLINFSKSQGKDWSDLDVQIQFLCMETDWNATYSGISFQFFNATYLNAFKNGSVEEATVAFRKGWERCGDGEANDAQRIASALSAYNTLAGRTTEYPIDKITASSTTSGSQSSSVTGDGVSLGGGNVKYSYDDMYFAFYQIEKWYENSTAFLTASNLQIVNLPEGGFAWPVKISSGNEGAKSIYRFAVSGHSGIDISTGNVSYFDKDDKLNKGELVVATHDGVVTKVQKVTDENKNAYIEIKTEDGNFKTKYCHLSEIYVSEGDSVTKNQEIGRIGKTGAHVGDTELVLHYEIYYKGKNMDPLTYYNIFYNGEVVKDYEELDLTTIAKPKEYKYESSKTYLGSGGAVVEFAAQYLGYNLNQLQELRGNYLNNHWCAWFASWCLRECGIDVIECRNTNYCPTIWNETKGEKHPYGDGYVPKPGDIIMFYSPDTAQYTHIAIVSKVENGTVYWIGGNQGGNCPFGSKVTENSIDNRLKSYITY